MNKPIESYYSYECEMMNGEFCKEKPVRQLEQVAGEMAKVIMHYLVKSEEEGYCELCENHEHSDDCEGKIGIEKYSGKTYEQLKKEQDK